MLAFPEDWCYVVINLATGFASIRDAASGLEIWEADSLDEAIAFLKEQQ